MDGQIPESVKSERSDILLKTEAALSLEYRKSFLGKKKEVLMEEKTVIGGRDYLVGYTREYVKAAVLWDREKRGKMVTGTLKEMLTDEILLLEEDLSGGR